MGQKSATESLAIVIQAFLVHRTWKQSDLAKHVDIGVPALRKHILSLQAAGVPLYDEKDPPNVFWSVPRAWFPGGVFFPTSEVGTLLRHLARLPRSKDRDRLLRIAVEATKGAVPDVVSRDSTQAEERFLTTIEDAVSKRQPLRFRYYTASRGADSLRDASVHRVFAGPPARFIATCHRDDSLKWFRVDNVSDATLLSEGFRTVEPSRLEKMISGSLDGFMGDAVLEKHVFFVSEPDARSVSKNLLEGMKVQDVRGGVRISIETTAVIRLARYVVALGAAARAETESLRTAVLELAKGSARSHEL